VTDTATVRQVIRYLGLVTLVLVGGAVYLASTKVNEALFTPIVGLAGTAVGVLGALLVHTGSVDPAPTPEQATDAQPEEVAGE
jgi:hypothetical protein